MYTFLNLTIKIILSIHPNSIDIFLFEFQEMCQKSNRNWKLQHVKHKTATNQDKANNSANGIIMDLKYFLSRADTKVSKVQWKICKHLFPGEPRVGKSRPAGVSQAEHSTYYSIGAWSTLCATEGILINSWVSTLAPRTSVWRKYQTSRKAASTPTSQQDYNTPLKIYNLIQN